MLLLSGVVAGSYHKTVV